MKYLYLLGASLGYFFHGNFNLSVGIFHIIKRPHQWLYDEQGFITSFHMCWNKGDPRNITIWGFKECTQGVNIGSAVVDDANRSCSTVWIRVHLQEWREWNDWAWDLLNIYWPTKEWFCGLKHNIGWHSIMLWVKNLQGRPDIQHAAILPYWNLIYVYEQ